MIGKAVALIILVMAPAALAVWLGQEPYVRYLMIGVLLGVTLTLEGSPVTAAVNWINPEFDEHTRKLAVELVIPVHDGPHRGGLLAELTLEVETAGLMVPRVSVSDRYENPRVRLKSDGRSIPVVILGENGPHLLIARNQDLAPGMELAPNPQTPQ